MSDIRTALLSVYDKSGLVEFASALRDRGVRLVSTGGTCRHLRDAGIDVVALEQLTGQAEMLGGRVKTLHPHVFGGILARRESTEQMRELEVAGVERIDMVVVNLYPFEATIAAPDHLLHEALEQIDIGGVSLLRAAYKNMAGVMVVVDPADYTGVVEALGNGSPSLGMRLRLARKAAAHTAGYEAAICNYLNSLDEEALDLDAAPRRVAWPERLALTYERAQSLRYGENPHQAAAFYRGRVVAGIAAARQLQGKELSYNNILDADAAWQLAWALPVPGAAIIKHANPCGAAAGADVREAYVRARASDPVSAFGGIVACNATIDGPTATAIASTFIELVIAPAIDDQARAVLADKAGLRLLECPPPGPSWAATPELRQVAGGLLAQDRDPGGHERWEVVSRRAPSSEEERGLRFLWRVVPHVHSNAIILGRDSQLLGVGAGQMSRVDSCRIAVWKANDAGHSLEGSVAASDAFFPFADGVETLAAAGVKAIVQPGGSRRDDEVVAAADRLGLALVHTGTRHFRH